MDKDPTAIAVTSRSFSADGQLRAELLRCYSDVRFNDAGVSLAGNELVRFLAGRRGAITGLEAIDDDVLAALPSLAVVSKIGVGVDMLDLDAFERRGVRLARAGGTNSRSVAELTVLLMLGVLRRLPEVRVALRAGKWEQCRGRELRGKVVGIVGLGHVGCEVATLVSAFGCDVLGVDPYRSTMPRSVRRVERDVLLRESDIVTLHAPLNAQSAAMIGRRELSLMKSDAVVINTARGGLIDEGALLEALDGSRLGGAGLDVLAEEPPGDNCVIGHPKVLTTSHIGGSTNEAVYAMGRAAIDGLARALAEVRAEGERE